MTAPSRLCGLGGVGLVVLVLAAASPWAAQVALASDPERAALEHYQRASKLYKAARYEAALEQIEEARALDPRPVYEGFRAWCVFRSGDQAEGVRIIERLAASAAIEPKQKREFEAALGRMLKRAGRARVRVETERVGVHAKVDGKALTATEMTSGREVLPGSHRVEILDGEKVLRRTVRVLPGAIEAVTYSPRGVVEIAGVAEDALVFVDGRALARRGPGRLELPAGSRSVKVVSGNRTVLSRIVDLKPGAHEMLVLEEGPPESSSVPPPEPRPEAPPEGRSAWPFVVGGGGLLAAVGGAVLHLTAAEGESRSPADGGVVSTSAQGDALAAGDDGSGQRTAAYVLYGVGGAAVTGAVLWYLLQDPGAQDAAAAPRLLLIPRPGGLTLRAGW